MGIRSRGSPTSKRWIVSRQDAAVVVLLASCLLFVVLAFYVGYYMYVQRRMLVGFGQGG